MRADNIAIFEDHQGIIRQVAWQFAHNHTQAEDLYSLGREKALAVLSRWSPEKGKFSTFLTWCLRRAFIDETKKWMEIPATDVFCGGGDSDITYNGTVPDSAIPLPAAVTPGARYIARVIRHCENNDISEIMEAVESMMDECLLNEEVQTPSQMRRLLGERLHQSEGWRTPRIQSAFRELTEVIKEL